MKKIYVIVAATLIATSIFFVQNNDSESFVENNVQALAATETIHPEGYVGCYMKSHDDGTPGYYIVIRKCSDCKQVSATSASGKDKCMK